MPWKIFIALNMAKNLANEFPTGTPVLPSLKASTKEDAFICYCKFRQDGYAPESIRIIDPNNVSFDQWEFELRPSSGDINQGSK